MEEKLVSIIVPAYNHENYIIQCLESIKEQTYTRIELLICDDCSQDKTYDVAAEWLERNKMRFVNAHIFKNPSNLGIVKNCNNLLKQCSGEYVKDVASDDFLPSDCIEKMVEFANANEQYDLIFTNGYTVRENASYPPQKEDIVGKIYRKPINTEGDFFGRLYMYNRISAPTVFFRKKTFDKYGYYCEDVAYEDWEYWLRVARVGKIGFYNIDTIYYRLVEKSASHFGREKSEIDRFRRFYKEEEKIINMYSKYTNCTTDFFWCTVFLRAIKCRDFDTIVELWKERKMTLKKLIKGVIHKIKGFLVRYK